MEDGEGEEMEDGEEEMEDGEEDMAAQSSLLPEKMCTVLVTLRLPKRAYGKGRGGLPISRHG